VTVLNQIYEVDFKGFSYGFRPGRGAFSGVAYADCGGASWFVAVNARRCDGSVFPHCWTGGFPSPEFCILIPTNASTLFIILGKSRVRKRARTDLCGGRSAMVVPTATAIPSGLPVSKACVSRTLLTLGRLRLKSVGFQVLGRAPFSTIELIFRGADIMGRCGLPQR
jgi:hypothetical protein